MSWQCNLQGGQGGQAGLKRMWVLPCGRNCSRRRYVQQGNRRMQSTLDTAVTQKNGTLRGGNVKPAFPGHTSPKARCFLEGSVGQMDRAGRMARRGVPEARDALTKHPHLPEQYLYTKGRGSRSGAAGPSAVTDPHAPRLSYSPAARSGTDLERKNERKASAVSNVERR